MSPKGPKVDMFAELQSHLQRTRGVPLSEWEPEEKACAVIAFNQVSQYITTGSKCPYFDKQQPGIRYLFPAFWIRGESRAPHPR